MSRFNPKDFLESLVVADPEGEKESKNNKHNDHGEAKVRSQGSSFGSTAAPVYNQYWNQQQQQPYQGYYSQNHVASSYDYNVYNQQYQQHYQYQQQYQQYQQQLAVYHQQYAAHQINPNQTLPPFSSGAGLLHSSGYSSVHHNTSPAAHAPPNLPNNPAPPKHPTHNPSQPADSGASHGPVPVATPPLAAVTALMNPSQHDTAALTLSSSSSSSSSSAQLTNSHNPTNPTNPTISLPAAPKPWVILRRVNTRGNGDLDTGDHMRDKTDMVDMGDLGCRDGDITPPLLSGQSTPDDRGLDRSPIPHPQSYPPLGSHSPEEVFSLDKLEKNEERERVGDKERGRDDVCNSPSSGVARLVTGSDSHGEREGLRDRDRDRDRDKKHDKREHVQAFHRSPSQITLIALITLITL